MEVVGRKRNLGIVGILENEILVDCGGRKEIRKKEKGKELIKGRYFSNLEIENIENTDSSV